MYNNFEKTQQGQNNKIKVQSLSRNSFYDYFESLHRFFRVSFKEQNYVAKVFPFNKIQEYQKELKLLEALEHPNIIRSVKNSHTICGHLFTQLKGYILLFPEAKFGNLLEYVTQFGGFTQKVAFYYLKKIVKALIYAENLGAYHPNLAITNILMTDDREIMLCGWSNSLQRERLQPSLEFAKLAIQLVTGRDPFPHKDIKKSQFYKFLTASHIHKFWEQLERSTRSHYRDVGFSEEFKNILELLLLNKINTYEQIDQLLFTQGITLQEVRFQLETRQKVVAEHRALQMKKI